MPVHEEVGASSVNFDEKFMGEYVMEELMPHRLCLLSRFVLFPCASGLLIFVLIRISN